MKKLYENTPVKTPVSIVNQPYLLGLGKGVLYMEVHAHPEDLDSVEFDKTYKKLRNIEKESGRTLDWSKVRKYWPRPGGFLSPYSRSGREVERGCGNHRSQAPGRIIWQTGNTGTENRCWTVLAAEVHDEIDAVKLAAIINHQGPQIPARVLSKDVSYDVIAGPFNDIREAKDAIKRLKIDLEIDGILKEPLKITEAGRR